MPPRARDGRVRTSARNRNVQRPGGGVAGGGDEQSQSLGAAEATVLVVAAAAAPPTNLRCLSRRLANLLSGERSRSGTHSLGTVCTLMEATRAATRAGLAALICASQDKERHQKQTFTRTGENLLSSNVHG
jgi:hypothetical protein